MSERSSCAMSSKNAKDKSNSTTLMAMRDTKERANDSSGRSSQCSSEKDSGYGYSDSSDWQHTDGEDQRSNKSQPIASDGKQTSQLGQNEQLGQRNPGMLPFISAVQNQTPTYIIKDLVLKQPDIIQRRDMVRWKTGVSYKNFMGSPHVVLYQQPIMFPGTPQLHKPSPRRSSAKKTNASYMPILNSYPRIAPHPNKKPPDKSSLSHESQSLSKRVCTDTKIDDTSVIRGLPEEHLHKQPKLAVSASDARCSSTTSDALSSSGSSISSSHQRSMSVTSLHITSSSLTSRGHHRDSTSSTRHRRFLNTVEILRQSGLLDITLRTKELLRQSSATERGIAQLRQHTELLCQAATGTHNSSKEAWEHLHQVMADSQSYPNLKALSSLQVPPYPDSVIQPINISWGDLSESQVTDSSSVLPPNVTKNKTDQVFDISQQTHSEKARKLKVDDKTSDTITPTLPDSSTE